MSIYWIINEEWRDIAAFPGYQISNMGRLKSLKRKRHPQDKILKLGYHKDYRAQYSFWKNHHGNTRKIHRLVAEAFIPMTFPQ